MANAKKITAYVDNTGDTVYGIIVQEATGHLLNDADGAFAAAPADPYVSATEHATIKGRFAISEARTAWADGLYTFVLYNQTGGAPAPASDTPIASGEMYIVSDAEVYEDATIGAIYSSVTATQALVVLYLDAKVSAIARGGAVDITSNYDALNVRERSVSRGDKVTITCQLLENDEAVDITGKLFRYGVKADPADSAYRIGAVAGVIIDAAQGTFSFTLSTTLTDIAAFDGWEEFAMFDAGYTNKRTLTPPGGIRFHLVDRIVT